VFPLCSFHTADTDKTKLFCLVANSGLLCLVRVGGVKLALDAASAHLRPSLVSDKYVPERLSISYYPQYRGQTAMGGHSGVLCIL